jgi:hypothetical protein
MCLRILDLYGRILIFNLFQAHTYITAVKHALTPQ